MDRIACHETYRQMARAEEVSLSTITQDVKVIRRYWEIHLARSYEAMVQEEREILETLHRAVMPVALKGGKGDTPSMWAVDRVLAIRERLAKLEGLDAPTRTDSKITVEHTTTLDAEIETLLAEMAQPKEEPSVNGVNPS